MVDSDFADGQLDDTFIYFIYAAGSTVLVIIMLNLLIAIISDTFDRINSNRMVNNYKAKTHLILEVATFFMFGDDVMCKFHCVTYENKAALEDD